MGTADNAIKPLMYGLHKATGITVLFLVIIRVAIRLNTKTPPAVSKGAIDLIVRSVHFMLYLLMFCLPISGYIMSSASGRDFTWYFDIKIPLIINKSQTLALYAHNAHSIIAYSLTALIAMHLLGTAKHIFIDKKNILKRIW